jgi:hypothetical protein
MIRTRPKHIVQPACLLDQNLEREKKDIIEVSACIEISISTSIQPTFIGLIFAIDEKKRETTCSPP